MIHRAVLGSFERFIGILIENYAGKLPLWLAPIQIMIAPIISDANDYADTVKKEFVNNGFRVEIDKRNEKISYKVREHSLSKIPYILALGKKEIADNTVNVRKIGSKDTNTMKIKDFLNELKTERKESNKC